MGNCFGTPADSDADDAPKQYSWDTRPDVNPDVSIVVTDPSQFSPPLTSSLCFSFVLMGYGMTSFVCAATLRAGLHLQRLGRSDRRQDAGDYRWPNVYAGTSEKLHSVSKVGMRLQLCLIASLLLFIDSASRAARWRVCSGRFVPPSAGDPMKQALGVSVYRFQHNVIVIFIPLSSEKTTPQILV